MKCRSYITYCQFFQFKKIYEIVKLLKGMYVNGMFFLYWLHACSVSVTQKVLESETARKISFYVGNQQRHAAQLCY